MSKVTSAHHRGWAVWALVGAFLIVSGIGVGAVVASGSAGRSVTVRESEFKLSSAHNPVQDIYLRQVKGNVNEVKGVAVKALADPAKGCKM